MPETQKQMDKLWELFPPYVFIKGHKWGGENEGINNIFGPEVNPNDPLLLIAAKDFRSSFGALNKTTFLAYGLASVVGAAYFGGTDAYIPMMIAGVVGTLSPALLFSVGSVAGTHAMRKHQK